MSLTGQILNGAVVLDSPAPLPDGTPVKVEEIPPKVGASPAGQSLLERMKPVVGIAEGLPADAATNVDHYLYGHPKK